MNLGMTGCLPWILSSARCCWGHGVRVYGLLGPGIVVDIQPTGFGFGRSAMAGNRLLNDGWWAWGRLVIGEWTGTMWALAEVDEVLLLLPSPAWQNL
ncbi:MAG: hypothetical protein C7B44_12170 [Sulfobacillus thermosulfidooxidans]|nr:MAG: hypothetical protein C7B44_12170 [Sulfobacillus thermosulfidooxidans]